MVDRLLGKKVIGIKQSTKSLKNGEGKCLYIAKDAQGELVKPVEDLASSVGVEIKYVDTMKDLGKLCGIDVGAAVTLLLKD
jgi:large subunit ribosomal protein L7A